MPLYGLKTIFRIEEKLRLLVTVHSSPENTERRRIIRKTWGDKIKKLPGVKVLYVFGKSNDNAEIKVCSSFHRFLCEFSLHT